MVYYKSVISNKILISLFLQSQFIYHCLLAKHPRCTGCAVLCVLPTGVDLLCTHIIPPYQVVSKCCNWTWITWIFAPQVSLWTRHKTVQPWQRDKGKHWRRNAAGHKAITPTLKIIHRGQSSFTASFLDKNKRRGFGFCGGIQGREGVA